MTTAQQPCFVEFRVDSRTRFAALCAAFLAIKHDKDTGVWRDETDWLIYFDDAALAQFWWPTQDEWTAHQARWWSTPLPERWTDPAAQAPSWLFASMLEAFENGEYELLACWLVDAERGRLEFTPLAYPYGGTGCLQMLVRAFGFMVTAIDDGTGSNTLDA